MHDKFSYKMYCWDPTPLHCVPIFTSKAGRGPNRTRISNPFTIRYVYGFRIRLRAFQIRTRIVIRVRIVHSTNRKRIVIRTRTLKSVYDT